jgi:hypothetical protein
MRRCPPTIAVPLIGLGVLAPAAGADPEMRVAVTPPVLSFPGASGLTYRIDISTGDAPERFALELAPRLLPDGGAGLTPASEPRLTGAGAIPSQGLAIGIPGCSPARNRFHGYEPQTTTVDLAIPERTTTTLVADYRVGAFTPWPGANVGLRIRALRRLTDGTQGTLSAPAVRLRSPQPRLDLRRRSGVRLRLFTSPRSDSTAGNRRPARIARGRRVLIRGDTWPRLRNVRVRLAAVYPGSARLRTIATVRTDRRGRFRYRRWRPRRLGGYELWVFYPRQRERFLSDHRCPRGFRLVE